MSAGTPAALVAPESFAVGRSGAVCIVMSTSLHVNGCSARCMQDRYSRLLRGNTEWLLCAGTARTLVGPMGAIPAVLRMPGSEQEPIQAQTGRTSESDLGAWRQSAVQPSQEAATFHPSRQPHSPGQPCPPAAAGRAAGPGGGERWPADTAASAAGPQPANGSQHVPEACWAPGHPAVGAGVHTRGMAAAVTSLMPAPGAPLGRAPEGRQGLSTDATPGMRVSGGVRREQRSPYPAVAPGTPFPALQLAVEQGRGSQNGQLLGTKAEGDMHSSFPEASLVGPPADQSPMVRTLWLHQFHF